MLHPGSSSSLPFTANEREALKAIDADKELRARIIDRVSHQQVRNRIVHVDSVKRQQAIGCSTMPSSDFRIVELHMQGHFEEGCFQRGNAEDKTAFPENGMAAVSGSV
jgi:hypothetical protein